MVYFPLLWFSNITCIALQMALFYKLRKPKSLKYLMLFLTVLTIVLIFVRNHPVFYWDTVWTGRMIGMCWFLWAVGDICNLEKNCHWLWRVPVFGNVIMFFWYEPYSPWTTVEQMETFIGFGFAVGMTMVLINLLLEGSESPSFHSLTGLGSFLSLEISSALLEIKFPHSIYPLIASILGLAAWVAILSLPEGSGGARSLAPAPQLLPRDY